MSPLWGNKNKPVHSLYFLFEWKYCVCDLELFLMHSAVTKQFFSCSVFCAELLN